GIYPARLRVKMAASSDAGSNLACLDTPHKRFFKRLIIGASLFATCSLLTQLLLAKDVPLPFLLTGLTLVLGVTAELGPLHAKLLPASLTDKPVKGMLTGPV
ncbi:FUSC family membrane protein, partial [Escherichia sp. TWPC-MK]